MRTVVLTVGGCTGLMSPNVPPGTHPREIVVVSFTRPPLPAAAGCCCVATTGVVCVVLGKVDSAEGIAALARKEDGIAMLFPDGLCVAHDTPPPPPPPSPPPPPPPSPPPPPPPRPPPPVLRSLLGCGFERGCDVLPPFLPSRSSLSRTCSSSGVGIWVQFLTMNDCAVQRGQHFERSGFRQEYLSTRAHARTHTCRSSSTVCEYRYVHACVRGRVREIPCKV